jgi:hypothetical protein
VIVTQTLFYANLDAGNPPISKLTVSLASISNTIHMLWTSQRSCGPLGWGLLRWYAVKRAATCMLGGLGILIGTKFTALTTVSRSMTQLWEVAPTAFAMCSFTVGAFLFRLIDRTVLFPLESKTS